MPPQIPKPAWMVVISGIAEIAGGLGILIPGTQNAARWGLIVLLFCVFPANVYMAQNHISPAGAYIPQFLLWARLPVQPLMMWWVFIAAQPDAGKHPRLTRLR